MNRLDRIIAAVSPKWAASRARYRAYLETLEEFPNRHRRTRHDYSPNAEGDRRTKVSRVHARALDMTHDVAKGALDTLVANTVGPGIAPEPNARLTDGSPALEFNRAALDLWERWSRVADVSHQLSAYQAQRLLCRSWLRDGEAFVNTVAGSVPLMQYAGPVPFALELLEAEMCPADYDADGVRQGVARNAWGRPIAYFFYKIHPDDGATIAFRSDLKRVPAERVQHIRNVHRIGQIRGVSIFESVLQRIEDVREIDETERVAARAAACFAAAVIRGTPDDYGVHSAKASDSHIDLEPGIVIDNLAPGESLETISPNRPNNALIPFRESQQRSMAAGLGISYSSLSRHYAGSYSSQRQELVEQFGAYGVMHSEFVVQHVAPTYRQFLLTAEAAGLLPTAGLDRETMFDAAYSRPAMPWIDPVKELKAAQIARGEGWRSDSDIIRAAGRSPRQTWETIQQDDALREELGVERPTTDEGRNNEPAENR